MGMQNWLPPALSDNPVFTNMARVMNDIWEKEINKNVRDLQLVMAPDLDTMTREDLIRFAKKIGWTFQDSFAPDDVRGLNFIRQFVNTWSNFCQEKGTPYFEQYMKYLLQLPLTIHVMWSKAYDPTYDLVLGDNFLAGGNGYTLPVYPTVSYGAAGVEFKRFADLTLTDIPIWEGGEWYPTSHVELEYDPNDVPNSAFPGLTEPDDIMRSLFYTIAPIQLVLKSIVRRYNAYSIFYVPSGTVDQIHFL